MKKYLIFILAICISTCFAACKDSTEPAKASDSVSNSQSDDERNDDIEINEDESVSTAEEVTTSETATENSIPKNELNIDTNTDTTEKKQNLPLNSIKMDVSKWTLNETNGCVYKYEYDEEVKLMTISVIFLNAESEPEEKATEIENFIIDNIGLSKLREFDPDFHLGTIIMDRQGNLIRSSIDGNAV